MRRFSGFEVAHFDASGHVFPPHSHDEFIVGANILGRERITLDRKALEAAVDDLTLFNPGEVQTGFSLSDSWTFVSIYVLPETVEQLVGLGQDVVFEAPVQKSPAIGERVKRLVFNALDQTADEQTIAEGLADLLGELLSPDEQTLTQRSSVRDPIITSVRDRLQDLINDPPPLDELSQQTGLTPVQLVRAFKRVYGLPPFKWLANERLNFARRRLAAGERPAHVAADLGFADQAHLTRRFRSVYGITPSAYVRVK